MQIELYSDGSGNTFESDGGYGYVMLVDGVKHSEGSGYISSATNNVAELSAAIEGLKAVKTLISKTLVSANCPPNEITLISDSQLVLGYASGRYQCKALHLTPYYIELRQLYNELKCTQRWERGHQGEINNERCDKLAKQARLSKGL
jgi:ribonuclease HI